MRTDVKKEHPLEIYFIYLGNKEMYCIFKTWCIMSVLFSTNSHLFHNFIFFFSNDALKFKYQPFHLKVNKTSGFFLNLITADLTRVAINLYMPEYPLCNCFVPFVEDPSEMFAV